MNGPVNVLALLIIIKVIFIYRVGENIKIIIVQMDLTVTHPRNQVSEVIIEANAVFQVVLTSERKYSKAKKPKDTKES